MFEVGKDYYADNPRNYDDWNKHPITVYKRTKNFIWIYSKHMITDITTLSDNTCKKVKTYITNGGYEGIKVNDALFYSK